MEMIIAANWKMHKTSAEAAAFCSEISRQEESYRGVDVVVCPPFTALPASKEALKGSAIKLGAQNTYWEDKGAFTGEIAPFMLKDLGVEYVILGHSERRHILGEDDGAVRRKLEAALKHGLTPILCVGETESERTRGETEKVLERQVSAALKDLDSKAAAGLVIAYEPVWAIGTGKAASPADAESAAALVLQIAGACLGSGVEQSLRVQYGGSVKAENIGEFVSLPSVSGALVGGASLEADSFSKLIVAAREAVTR